MSAKWDSGAGTNGEPESGAAAPEAGWGPWVEEGRNRLPFSYSQIDFSCEIAVRLEYRVPSGHDDTRPG